MTKRFNILMSVREHEGKQIYHFTIHPSDFAGGAVPYRDYIGYDGFVNGCQQLGFSPEQIAGITTELIKDRSAYIVQFDLTQEAVEAFGWPTP